VDWRAMLLTSRFQGLETTTAASRGQAVPSSPRYCLRLEDGFGLRGCGRFSSEFGEECRAKRLDEGWDLWLLSILLQATKSI
jgi:hypothetical protein